MLPLCLSTGMQNAKMERTLVTSEPSITSYPSPRNRVLNPLVSICLLPFRLDKFKKFKFKIPFQRILDIFFFFFRIYENLFFFATNDLDGSGWNMEYDRTSKKYRYT